MTFRKSPKNILALALLLISGYAFSDSEYFYNELEDGVEIAGCDGDCYFLPEYIDGKSVIGISDTAFFSNIFIGTRFVLTWKSGYNIPYDIPYDTPLDILDINNRPIPMQEHPIQNKHYYVPSIKIPQGYQYIGDYFFSSNSLKNISLNEGLQTIGMQAFSSNDIRDIVIPDSVSEISSGAFSDNPLSHIIFSGNRPNIGDGAFLTPYDRVSCLLGMNPEDCEYRDDAIFSPQEGWGWGPIHPPGALNLILEDSNDGYFDAIPEGDYLLNEPFILDLDELTELASQLPESEISNSFSLKDMHPPKIYYCSEKSGWPGDPINGVVPEERNCDSVVWDIDQNNSVDALTDGLLLMRYAFGLRGDSLTENVISSDSLIDKAAVDQNIEQIMHLVDINDDGNFDALTDALILLRYLFGMSGNGLVDEEMFTSNRPSAGSIKAYIESHMIKALSN